jgi:hypothetical protein
MDIEEKAQIENIINYAEDNFGEWKIVIQKNSDGKIRTHTSFPTDIQAKKTSCEGAQEIYHLTSWKKSLIIQ